MKQHLQLATVLKDLKLFALQTKDLSRTPCNTPILPNSMFGAMCRNRRLKESNRAFGTDFAPPQSKKKHSGAKSSGLSSVGLTPGTLLMAEIERNLEFYICQRLQRWKHLEFELSGATVQVCHAHCHCFSKS